MAKFVPTACYFDQNCHVKLFLYIIPTTANNVKFIPMPHGRNHHTCDEILKGDIATSKLQHSMAMYYIHLIFITSPYRKIRSVLECTTFIPFLLHHRKIRSMRGLALELSERGSKKGALKAVKSCRKKAKISFSCKVKEQKSQLF